MDDDTSSQGQQQRDPASGSAVDPSKLVQQLRSAPAEEIVADVFSMLLNAAQVKLGRRDARLFIDLCSVMSEHSRRHLSEELVREVESALGQLRLGQVSAEHGAGGRNEPEPNDLSPTPPASGGPASA